RTMNLDNLLPGTIEKVLALLVEHNGNYDKVVSKTSLSKQAVYWIDVIHNKKFNKTEGGLGPEHMKPYLVATRPADSILGWDNKDPKVMNARDLYDKGLVELV